MLRPFIKHHAPPLFSVMQYNKKNAETHPPSMLDVIIEQTLKAESDLPTMAFVAGMNNNISKTLNGLGNIFPIYFSLMTEMIWERDFRFSFSFAQ